jgi:hypothetical protein
MSLGVKIIQFSKISSLSKRIPVELKEQLPGEMLAPVQGALEGFGRQGNKKLSVTGI